MFHFHSTITPCSFEERECQDSLQSLKISPYRQSKAISLLRNKIKVEQGNSNLTISVFKSERGSFSFSDLDPVQEREETDSIDIGTEYIS